jgi:hypothetical protein
VQYLAQRKRREWFTAPTTGPRLTLGLPGVQVGNIEK